MQVGVGSSGCALTSTYEGLHALPASRLSLRAWRPSPAQSTPKQVHTSPQEDPGVYSGRLKVDYPTPYELGAVDASADAERVHAYVDPGRARAGDQWRHGRGGHGSHAPAGQVALARTDLQILTYEWGVTYAGMLRSCAGHGRRALPHYTDERVLAIATLAAHAQKNLPPGTTRANYPMPKHGLGLRSILLPRRSTIPARCARRLIKAELAGLRRQELRPGSTTTWSTCPPGQFRLRMARWRATARCRTRCGWTTST